MSAGVREAPQTGGPIQAALARLEADGFIAESGRGFRTTRKWQRAMAHAAVTLYERGEPGDDLRVPIAFAIVHEFALRVDDEFLATLVEAILPIELAALGLRPDASGPPRRDD